VASRHGTHRPSLALVICGASLLGSVAGAWIVSPRRTVDGPSLIDDWSAIARSGGRLRDLSELVNPSGQRFRPAFDAWNYLQWHTLGAPGRLLGPELWGLARLVLMVAGLASVTVLLLRCRPRALRARDELALAALPALFVVVVPWFGIDLARFGPQEPLLVGGMTLGGSLLYLAMRDLLARRPWYRLKPLAGLVAGYALWLLGVYQKESSLCVLILIPFLALPHRTAIRDGLTVLDHRSRALLGGVVVAVALPLAHVAFAVIRIVQHGDLVYGTKLHSGGGVRHAVDAFLHMRETTASPVGWILLVGACAGIVLSCARGRADWAQIGLVLTGFASLAWSAQTDLFPSRYYIPLFALLAVAFSLTLASIPTVGRWVVVGLAVLFVAKAAGNAHGYVVRWAAGEKRSVGLVATVARLKGSGCPVVTGGLDVEVSVSLPVLVRLRHPGSGSCASGRLYVVRGPLPLDAALQRVCLPGTSSLVYDAGSMAVSGCRSAPGSGRLIERRRLS
jgi:hypothetical protein